MEVILLINLPLELPINRQPQKIRILLARGQRRVKLGLAKDLLKLIDGLPGTIHLLLDRILKVASQPLDLFDLRVEIVAQADESQDHVLLDLLGLSRFGDGLLVEVAQDLQGVIDATFAKEPRRSTDAVQHS